MNEPLFLLLFLGIAFGMWIGTYVPEITPDQMDEAKERCKNSEVHYVDKGGFRCKDGLSGAWKEDE